MPVSGLFKVYQGIGRVQRELMHAFFSGLGCGSSSGNALYSGIPLPTISNCNLRLENETLLLCHDLSAVAMFGPIDS